MSDLAAFIEARLADDERIANEATMAGQIWSQADPERYPGHIEDSAGVVVYDEGAPTGDQAAHIARHDPLRVLREVEAKRAILAEHEPAWQAVEWPHDQNGKGDAPVCPRCQNAEHDTPEDPGVLPEGFVTSYVLAPCPTLLAILSVWSDHPDYDQGWKP